MRARNSSSSSSGSDDAHASVTTDAFTEEQHLVAAIMRLRKLEGDNQSALERMYVSLQSPFKLSTKRCEAQRAEVLRCYEGVLRPTNATTTTTTTTTAAAAGSARAQSLSDEEVLQLPLYTCCDAVAQYQRCVDAEVRERHVELASKLQQSA